MHLFQERQIEAYLKDAPNLGRRAVDRLNDIDTLKKRFGDFRASLEHYDKQLNESDKRDLRLLEKSKLDQFQDKRKISFGIETNMPFDQAWKGDALKDLTEVNKIV